MLLVVLTVLAVATVPLAGGRLGRLGALRLRGLWVLAGALGIQVLVISVIPGADETANRALHLGTYVAVLVWVAWSRGLPWRWPLVAGGFLNFLVIAVNEGVMPASRAAVRLAGLGGPAGFENSAPLADARLGFLGDVFAVPASWPLANVFSIGDVLIVVGVFLVVHRQCESFLAYLLARLGDAVLATMAWAGGPSLGAWRTNGSHGRSQRSTRRTPPIPIGS